MFISHDEPRIDPCHPSGLCAMCDQPVELHEVAVGTIRTHGMEVAYLCHEFCLTNYDDDEEE